MRRTISVLLLVMFAITLSPAIALSDNLGGFKVSSFIPERFSDLEWQIGGQFNLAGNDSEQNYEVAPGFDYDDRDTYSSSNRQNLDFNTSAVYYYETVKRQFELRLGFSGGLYHVGTDNNITQSDPLDNDFKSSKSEADKLNYNLSTYVRASIRQYFDERWFGEFSFSNSYSDNQTAYDDVYGSSVNYRHYDDRVRVDHQVNDREITSGRRYNLGSFAIAFGVGHIYEGSFASTAMHIIDQLEKSGLMRSDPSEAQMLDLTEIIYYYRLKHVIDDRIHRQNALNEIITFLEDERIIRNINSEALYAIQDVWDYYPTRKRTPRLFGFRIKAGLGYLTAFERDNRTREDVEYRMSEEYELINPSVRDTLLDTVTTSYSSLHESRSNEIPYFTASAEYHLPINHLWQFDAEIMTDITLETV